MLILEVAIPCPLPQTFSYLANDSIDIKNLSPGIRMLVPFGNRKICGIYLGIQKDIDFDANKLKTIISAIDTDPIIPAQTLKLLKWISQYYHHPIGEVFKGALPFLLTKECDLSIDHKKQYYLNLDQAKSLSHIKGSRQKQIIQFLIENHSLTEEQFREQAFSLPALNALLSKNYIKFQLIDIIPLENISDETPPNPTPEQQQAIDLINKSTMKFRVFLLHGITGSGKTEVYFRVIEKVLQVNRQILFLIPEIGLTPQTINRIKSRFHQPVGIFHSNLTNKERIQQWLYVKTNKVKIIIGTRSAIFSPFVDLGLIIIDEEHDASFKQQEQLRYSARDVGIVYAKQLNIPIILGSATPSLESYQNAKSGKYSYIQLKNRVNRGVLPKIYLIDIRQQFLSQGFSKIVIDKIQEHLQKSQQVLIFLNRRGFSPKLICHHCGYVFQCDHCDKALTFHKQKQRLICHYCQAQKNIPKSCQNCKHTNLQTLGIGTEKIEEFLVKRFSQYKVVRIDRDTTQKRGKLTEIINRINNNEFDILLGTQMLAKGHHFPKVTLAVILDTDSHLFSNDLRASERMGQLLTQVAGRSGRESNDGEVLIQSRHPDHSLLQLMLQPNYQLFIETLLAERNISGMPPFSYLALIRTQAKSADEAQQFLEKTKQVILKQKHDIHVLGPITAPISKRQNKFHYQLLLQSTNRSLLQTVLKSTLKAIPKIKKTSSLKFSIDLDPIDFF